MDCPATTPHAHSGEHNCILSKENEHPWGHVCECGRRWSEEPPHTHVLEVVGGDVVCRTPHCPVGVWIGPH